MYTLNNHLQYHRSPALVEAHRPLEVSQLAHTAIPAPGKSRTIPRLRPQTRIIHIRVIILSAPDNYGHHLIPSHPEEMDRAQNETLIIILIVSCTVSIMHLLSTGDRNLPFDYPYAGLRCGPPYCH